ncbi:hypothetical protein [Streptomyces syringium]|uniref:hypothetical protein n=1 Tax=Streptomyces syringium TaxID=76729 RepID=UPI003454CDF4
MQQTLTLRYVPEIDDLVELLAGCPERRRLRKRAIRSAVAILLLLSFVVWVGTVEPTSDISLPVLFLAVAFGHYALRAFAFSFRWGLRRQARAIWQGSSELQQVHEEEIGPEALTLRTKGLSCTHAWSQFGEFRESSRQFVLLDHSGEPSVVVPKRGLSGTILVPVCRTLLTEYLAGASPSGSTPRPPTAHPRPQEPGSQRDRST